MGVEILGSLPKKSLPSEITCCPLMSLPMPLRKNVEKSPQSTRKTDMCRSLSDGHPTFNRKSLQWVHYMNPYYWAGNHPLLYGNNGSLEPIAHAFCAVNSTGWWDPFSTKTHRCFLANIDQLFSYLISLNNTKKCPYSLGIACFDARKKFQIPNIFTQMVVLHESHVW